MGRKNTSKAATLSTSFRKAMYRFGSYEENSHYYYEPPVRAGCEPPQRLRLL